MLRLIPVLAVLAFLSAVAVSGPAGTGGAGAVGSPVMAWRAADATSTPGAMMSAAPGAYRAPVAGSVVVLRPFTPPRVRYGPGHLGVDLRVRAGDAALAAGSGVVRFAGVVAGRGVVVVAHPDGLLTEYEPVEPALPAGTHVESGSVLGRVRGVHRGCVPAGECLHWGARRGGTYLDPLTLLLPLGQVRLVPWGAST